MSKQKLTSSKAKTTSNKDRFTLYAAAIVLVLMLVSSSLIYINVNSTNRNENYASLPEVIVTNQGVAVRLKASIQVKKEDADWLSEHQNNIHGQFRQELSQLDLSSLRTTQGITAAQKELSEKLNQAFHTNKIEGVFFTELLIQDQS